MVYSRLSVKEYKACCKNLKKSCNKPAICNAHMSLQSLSKISSTLKEILAQGDEVSTDWEKDKKVHLSNYGYLNSAIHHPEIMEETNLIKKLVRNFNKGRAKIWE